MLTESARRRSMPGAGAPAGGGRAGGAAAARGGPRAGHTPSTRAPGRPRPAGSRTTCWRPASSSSPRARPRRPSGRTCARPAPSASPLSMRPTCAGSVRRPRCKSLLQATGTPRRGAEAAACSGTREHGGGARLYVRLPNAWMENSCPKSSARSAFACARVRPLERRLGLAMQQQGACQARRPCACSAVGWPACPVTQRSQRTHDQLWPAAQHGTHTAHMPRAPRRGGARPRASARAGAPGRSARGRS